MRILFSLTYFTPYVSGLTLYVKRLCEALTGVGGYQCSVISFQYEKKLKQEEVVNGVRVVRVHPIAKISKGFLSIDWVWQNIKEVRKTDIVVVSLPQLEGLIPALCAKIFCKKLITIYHCEVSLPKSALSKVIEWILHISHFFTLLLSDEIITYTQDYAKNSILLPIFLKKIKYIYPPISVPDINKSIQKVFKQKIGLLGHSGKRSASRIRPFIIGVAARLATEKGIEYLLEAIPLLKFQISNFKFQIVVAGSLNPVGEQAYKEKIMKLVEKYKKNIVFLGEVKEENMGSYYSLLDVLVLPSVNSTEAFGMVQVEAMMMGIPVVATDLAGVRVPIQRTGMGQIVPIRDAKSLAESIFEVITKKEKYVKNKQAIQKEFAIKKTIEFYKSLLKF